MVNRKGLFHSVSYRELDGRDVHAFGNQEDLDFSFLDSVPQGKLSHSHAHYQLSDLAGQYNEAHLLKAFPHFECKLFPSALRVLNAL